MAISTFLSPVHSAVKSPMGVLAIGDANWTSYDDYYIRLNIELEDSYRSGTFTDMDIDVRSRLGPDNEVVFNINRLLESQLSFDRPDIAAIPDAVKATNVTKRFKVRLDEYKNGAINSSVSGAITHAYLAGFAHTKTTYMLTHINLKKFLTYQPSLKSVADVQPEFLYLVALTSDTYSLKVNLTHDDGSTTNGYDPGISIDADAFDVLIFPTGFNQLGLDSINPGVKSWEIYIDNDLSESRTYELDCHCSPLDRYYLAANSLGGFDTIRTSGELTVKDETQGQTVQKILGPYYQTEDRSFQNVDTYIRETCTQHTGHLTQEENFWLKDLLLSEDVYRIGNYLPNLEATGDLLPIVIDRASIPRYQDQNFLYGFSFSYKDGFQSRGI